MLPWPLLEVTLILNLIESYGKRAYVKVSYPNHNNVKLPNHYLKLPKSLSEVTQSYPQP